MKRFGGFEGITRHNEPLAGHTTFHIGGPAEVFVEPHDVEELRDVVRFSNEMGLPVLMLGRGSNLLVSDEGVRGIVVVTRRLSRVRRHGSVITAESGVSLPKLVNMAVRWGLGGLEALVGIPGTVGGALAMNAGGKYGMIGSLVHSVTVIEPDGALRPVRREELLFGNRASSLKDAVVAEASFELSEAPGQVLSDRARAIIEEKKRSQPLSARSAGCIFRNPPGGYAGALIDRAGLKSQRVGGARVSSKHANFIVNSGRASARDVLGLIEVVRRRVAERFEVRLETEVEMWGFHHAGQDR
jgi:UDP-N-acetylmuramate dehydrogenase